MKKLSKDKELQKRLKISNQDKVVMYLGSIHTISGLPVILNTIPKIIQSIPNFKLLIVGDGIHLEKLKSISKKLKIEDKVIFVGYVPYIDIPRYCSLAELCINPFEITDMTKKLSPVKIFDLLACDKPVLATPLEGMLYDFPKETNTIIYENLESFTDKMIELLGTNSLEQIGKVGRDFVAKNFTWSIVTKKMLNEFDNMIK